MQLKDFSFNKTGGHVIFASLFRTICDDYTNTTGAPIPTDIQRQALIDTIRTREVNGAGGVTLNARAPDVLTPLHQSFMSQRLSLEEMPRQPGMTCENILTSDPAALTPGTNASVLALATTHNDTCTICNDTGHTKRQQNEQTKTSRYDPNWKLYNDPNKQPPDDVRKAGDTDEWKWCDHHKHWGGHSTGEHHGCKGQDRDRHEERSDATTAAAVSTDADFGANSCMFVALADYERPPIDSDASAGTGAQNDSLAS